MPATRFGSRAGPEGNTSVQWSHDHIGDRLRLAFLFPLWQRPTAGLKGTLATLAPRLRSALDPLRRLCGWPRASSLHQLPHRYPPPSTCSLTNSELSQQGFARIRSLRGLKPASAYGYALADPILICLTAHAMGRKRPGLIPVGPRGFFKLRGSATRVEKGEEDENPRPRNN